MSDRHDPPTNPDDEAMALFSRFIDQRLDDDGMQRLETILREDPGVRDRCARRLLFEADLKTALAPDELEWLETRQVKVATKDGRSALEVRRSQELRVGRATADSPPTGRPLPVRKRRRWLAAGAVATLAGAAAVMLAFHLRSPGAPMLKNPGFEVTDLSMSSPGITDAVIDWQDYFTSGDIALCEISRVSDNRIFAKSGRNVVRVKGGGYLTQRLRDERGAPVLARHGARYVLSGWVHTDGSGRHLLRAALRVVASGRPAMIQYEAVNHSLEIAVKPGWQQFRIELDLGENLEREPSDVIGDQRPLLDLADRELTLSLDSRGDPTSLYYLDDLVLQELDP